MRSLTVWIPLWGLACAPTPEPAPDAGDAHDLELPAQSSVANGRFATSDTCATCHDNRPGATAMRDAAGRGVAPVDLWRSSMMANAARDPLWRAQMSAEIAATPAAAAAIAAKCTRCHAPMAAEDAALTGADPLTTDVLTAGGEATALALDGVSCTLCHQIAPDGLGAPPSFSGGFTVAGDGRIYGPHAAPFAHPMTQHTGYTPTFAAHTTESGLCATCHTLTTHALDADGAATGGHVVEQGPFLEWSLSDFAGETSCQACHLPIRDADGAPIQTRIAHNPNGGDFGQIAARDPYGRHLLVGGNTLVPAILRDWSDVLRPDAPPEAFDATIAAARDQLAARTGRVTVASGARDGDGLRFAARVEAWTGHKLPTGIPVRRVWLHTTVTDATGAVVFRSGAWDDAGRIVDDAGAPLASEGAGGPVLPHRDQVRKADEVPVYEAILADATGAPTWRLLRGEGWVKDNRLLPSGFDRPSANSQDIDAVGVDGDPDFQAGGDTVHYAVPVGDAPGPLRVTVELVYQPLSARWAAELFASGTREAAAFQVMYDAAARGPERISLAQADFPGE